RRHIPRQRLLAARRTLDGSSRRCADRPRRRRPRLSARTLARPRPALPGRHTSLRRDEREPMRTAAALLVAVSLFASHARATTNNDDSCDIGVYPAATLLLPYFEVEWAIRATDTFFTVTNVSNVPQIARVTVWTDWAYPVLTFNLFLTGYDVQSISMYDVIVNGVIAPSAAGTSSKVTPGALSAANSANPNLSVAGCDQ